MSGIELLGEKIRFFRIKKHVSDTEIADYVGLSRSSYIHIETGKKDPKVSELLKIIEYLNINLSDVLDYRVPRISEDAIQALAVEFDFPKYLHSNGKLDVSPRVYKFAKSVISLAHKPRA